MGRASERKREVKERKRERSDLTMKCCGVKENFVKWSTLTIIFNISLHS